MSDEIDEFIRRAAERRRQQQGQQTQRRPPAPAAPKVRVPTPPRANDIVEAEVISAEVLEDVATHVQKRMDNREFDRRAAQLGEQTALADDKLEARLQQTFDHRIGQLATSGNLHPIAAPTNVAAVVTTEAANEMLTFLVSALCSPQHVRQAVILSDILARPEHRW